MQQAVRDDFVQFPDSHSTRRGISHPDHGNGLFATCRMASLDLVPIILALLRHLDLFSSMLSHFWNPYHERFNMSQRPIHDGSRGRRQGGEDGDAAARLTLVDSDKDMKNVANVLFRGMSGVDAGRYLLTGGGLSNVPDYKVPHDNRKSKTLDRQSQCRNKFLNSSGA